MTTFQIVDREGRPGMGVVQSFPDRDAAQARLEVFERFRPPQLEPRRAGQRGAPTVTRYLRIVEETEPAQRPADRRSPR